MQTIPLSEAYENGFTIADLSVLLAKRFEELYDHPDPEETLRRIALSQDEWSFKQTRTWLKRQLLIRKPQRKHCTILDAVVDETLIQFYCGDTMYEATSAAHARQLSAQAEEQRLRAEAVTNEIQEELAGQTWPEMGGFLTEVIVPKYQDGWEATEFARLVLEAVRRHAAADPRVQPSLQAAEMQSIAQCFAGSILQSTADYLMSLAPKRIPDVAADVTAAQAAAPAQEEPMKDYAWTTHIKSFNTKTLTVGLVKKTGDDWLIEIGPLGSTQCKRIVINKGKAIGEGDTDTLMELLGNNKDHVAMMIKFITQEFTNVGASKL